MLFDIRECSYFDAVKRKFLSNIVKIETCWFYKKTKKNKYSHFSINGQKYQTYRIAYMLFKGPIPHDKLVRHTCDVKACVNPEHLILGSRGDNAEDAVKRNSLGQQKLNEEAVKVIKWFLKYHPKRGLAAKLALLYNVQRHTIYRIQSGLTWHWVKI